MIPHRKLLMYLCFAVVLVASILYDTLFVIAGERLRPVLAALVLVCAGGAVVLQKYPLRVIQPVIVAMWPLHLFTLSFFVVCLAFQGGARLGQVVAYTVVAYATYALLPLILVLDLRLFAAVARLIAILSAVFAIPSFFGAVGFDSLVGLPLRNKYSYAEFSGIIASGGLFEHPEGHALQMAAGLFCCYYVLRKSSSHTLSRYLFAICFVMILAGLIVSQGRGAIFGVAVAVSFSLLPELFRRSRLVFLASLLVITTFPFMVLPRLAEIPGFSSYFRIERGLSGREEAWEFALRFVEDKPWTGHGFLVSGDITEAHKKELRKFGFTPGTTFHNTFITKAVELGVIVTCIYSLMYIVPLLRICGPSKYPVEQQLVRNMILLALTTAIFRDYNIGGVRSTAVIGALFFGMANLWPLLASLEPACSPEFATEPRIVEGAEA